MNTESVREYLAENFHEAIIFDGLDYAIIGVDVCTERIVYSHSRIITALIANGMQAEEAKEYADYNILGIYLGEHGPIVVEDFFIRS